MSDFLPTKNEFLSSFDILPNEILLHIFDYLTSNEIIYSFINCNQRFKCLLLTQKYHFKIPTTNLDFWKETLPMVSPLIQTLVIHTDYLTVPLDFFPNLTSIIISSPYSLLYGQLQSILHHQCFQQLQTFKIKDVITLDDEEFLFRRIFDNDNSIQVFEYLPSLDALHNRDLGQWNSNIHIRSLILNLTFFYSIFKLIQYTPNLIYLNLQSEMPFVEYGKRKFLNVNQIRLEKFDFKCKPSTFDGSPTNRYTTDINQLFRFIHLFSLSLITLSLDLADAYLPDFSKFPINGVHLPDRSKVVFDGVQLENELLKPLKQLQNFHICIKLYKYRDNEQIFSTFPTFPWPMGTHRNAYLYSLPFSFHTLKRFHHFQDVQLNNVEIRNDRHRLWSQVRSLELVHLGKIDFKRLFPLIKLSMPKLAAITFHGNNGSKILHWDDLDDCDESCDEIERIHIQLDSVTTVHLHNMSMKQIEQILIHSFPNLQCLTLKQTELPSKGNELTSFFSEKLRRIECDALFSGDPIQEEKDFSSFLNLQHIKLQYGFVDDEEKLNSRSRIISNVLSKLSKLETLSIYDTLARHWFDYDYSESVRTWLMKRLDEKQIKTQYEIKYSEYYMWFIRNTHVSSSSF